MGENPLLGKHGLTQIGREMSHSYPLSPSLQMKEREREGEFTLISLRPSSCPFSPPPPSSLARPDKRLLFQAARGRRSDHVLHALVAQSLVMRAGEQEGISCRSHLENI